MSKSKNYVEPRRVVYNSNTIFGAKQSMKQSNLLLTALVVIGLIACNQEDNESCLDLDTTASFTVDETVYTVTHTPVWDNSGIYNSIGFRHDLAGGGQHIVTVIFEGDTVGVYPLSGQLDPHNAMYMGPSSNNNPLFTGPGETGTLTVTDIDTENGCLTGSYTFGSNIGQISGEFQSLRPN